MKNRQLEFLKINTFTVNWYALLACILIEKKYSTSQSLSMMGIKTNQEPIKRVNKFNVIEVEALYKKLKTVRQVALKLNCNQSTLARFMRINNIETNIIRTLKSDRYDLEKIMKLKNNGINLKTIAKELGYEYHNLFKMMQKIKKEKEIINE